MTPQKALTQAVNATDFSIRRIEAIFNHFNDPEWPNSLTDPLGLAREFLAINRVMPTPSVAEDYANLAGILNQIEWPAPSGSDLEADARLFDLQDRTGRLILDCVAIVGAAKEMGIGYAQPESLHPDGLRVPMTGHARMIDQISREVDDLEFHIEQLGSEQGTNDKPSRQQVLVINYRSAASRSIQTIRVAIGTGTSIALDVIQRASASLVITTKQFVATIQATSSKASLQLRKAVSALRLPVQTVARSIGTLIKQVAAQTEIKPAPIPEDFVEQAHTMILAGTAPPANWVPYLVKLDFSNTALADLTPLAGLSALQILTLDETQISDVSPLASLAALQGLDLWGTQVGDVGPLASLSALQRLDLWGTQVSDVGPLASLSALQSLKLNSTQITDISPLANLTGLKRLDLMDMPVSDISPLANLTALQSLNLNGTQVSDVSPLANLSRLQDLYLSGTEVSDINPLANLSALVRLDLWNTHVRDVSPLAKLTALQSLYLSGTQVSDVRPLANLSAIESLALMGMQITDVSPLASLSALQSLYLIDTPVSDVSSLAGLSALQNLTIWNTQITDISPLASLSALQSLHLSGTQISDVSPLASLTVLQRLHLRRTSVTDVGGLSGFTKLVIKVDNKRRAETLRATLEAGSSVKIEVED